METFSFVSDLHGDRQDKGAVRAFKTFLEDFKPKLRIFGGDLWDFRALRAGADKEERRQSMRTDFEAGMEFIEEYRPHAITLGNHDQRLWDAVKKDGLSKTGPLPDYAGELIERFAKQMAKLKVFVLPYDKRRGVYEYMGLKFTHGFVTGASAASNMALTYGDILFGHGHAVDVATVSGMTPKTARMVGCLCELDMDYNRAHLGALRQQHGWGYGAFFGENRYEIFQAASQGGKLAYAGQIKMISA